MKLTICLVTKGREKYIEQILASFETLLEDEDIHFLIMNNGAKEDITERLNEWRNRNSRSVKIIRFEVNDSRPAAFWDEVVRQGADWTVFPSDDDEFRPEIITEWKVAVNQNPKLVAFAASAEIMDLGGKLTGEILYPSVRRYQSKIQRVASALHEPPFLWPSLFLKVSKIPRPVPNSRFAFDWWIGINLLVAGDVFVSESLGINYRVHTEQESFLAPHRRKYFEAQFWLDDFLHSEGFLAWVNSLSDSEKYYFLRSIMASKPIYGDINFSKSLIDTLVKTIMKSLNSPILEQEIMAMYAYENGVLLKDGELKNLVYGFQDISSKYPGNLKVQFNDDVCDLIRLASDLLIGDTHALKLQISCAHSNESANSVVIDCGKLTQGKSDINADMIINMITSTFENQNRFNFTLTSGEREVIIVLRRWKSKLPPSLRQLLRKTKNSGISQ